MKKTTISLAVLLALYGQSALAVEQDTVEDIDYNLDSSNIDRLSLTSEQNVNANLSNVTIDGEAVLTSNPVNIGTAPYYDTTLTTDGGTSINGDFYNTVNNGNFNVVLEQTDVNGVFANYSYGYVGDETSVLTLKGTNVENFVDISTDSDLDLTVDAGSYLHNGIFLNGRGETNYLTLKNSQVDNGIGFTTTSETNYVNFYNFNVNGPVSIYNDDSAYDSSEMFVDMENTTFEDDLSLDNTSSPIELTARDVRYNGSLIVLSDASNLTFDGGENTISNLDTENAEGVSLTNTQDSTLTISSNNGSLDLLDNNGNLILGSGTLYAARIVNGDTSHISLGTNRLETSSDLTFSSGSILSLAISQSSTGGVSLVNGSTSTIRFEDGSSIEVEIIGQLSYDEAYPIVEANGGTLDVNLADVIQSIQGGNGTESLAISEDGKSIELVGEGEDTGTDPEDDGDNEVEVPDENGNGNDEVFENVATVMSQKNVAMLSANMMKNSSELAKRNSLSNLKEPSKATNFWVEGTGFNGDYDSAGYDTKGNSITIGSTHRITNTDSVVGFMFSSGNAEIDGNNGYRNDVDSVQGGLYGAVKTKSFHVNWSTMVAYNDYEQKREQLNNLGLVEGYSADYHGYQFLGDVSIGKDLQVSKTVTLTPYVGTNYIYSHISSYDEKGVGSNQVNVSDYDNQTINGYVGLTAKANFVTSFATVSPYVDVAYNNELWDNGDTNAEYGNGSIDYSEGYFDHSVKASVGVEATNGNFAGRVRVSKERNGEDDVVSGGLEVGYLF